VEHDFAKVGIQAAAARTHAEAAANPHMIERDMSQQIEHEDGKTMPLTGPAAKSSRTPIRIRTRATRSGEQTEAILKKLGIGAAECDNLRATKII
jgi:formyl-CoA transferase